jgi:kinesin family protein 6/9
MPSLLAAPLPQFEYFCATSPAHVAVAAHKAVLRSKYEEARALGSHVAASKQCISELKSTVEQRRLARSMAALLWQQQAGGGRDGSGSGEQQEGEERQQHDAEEERAKGLIEKVTACLPALCKLAAAAKLLLLLSF